MSGMYLEAYETGRNDNSRKRVSGVSTEKADTFFLGKEESILCSGSHVALWYHAVHLQVIAWPHTTPRRAAKRLQGCLDHPSPCGHTNHHPECSQQLHSGPKRGNNPDGLCQVDGQTQREVLIRGHHSTIKREELMAPAAQTAFSHYSA